MPMCLNWIFQHTVLREAGRSWKDYLSDTELNKIKHEICIFQMFSDTLIFQIPPVCTLTNLSKQFELLCYIWSMLLFVYCL